jgi:hypothetical protein
MTATPDFQMCLAAVRRVAERGEEFTTEGVL